MTDSVRLPVLASTYPSANLEMIMIGPNDSSFAINILSVTSVKIVGYIKRPTKHMMQTQCSNDLNSLFDRGQLYSNFQALISINIDASVADGRDGLKSGG